ncbi:MULTISPECIES: hypothetical protein [Citrobacter]|uniref:hypothetical protein n=1 Tax=Citrobacter TaxID=544 RepID=UPI001BD020D1|nr:MULTISPECIES: hypothetical protein [Citrobacter]EKT9262212.1 hypothetical protein [Citrobacter freundii]EKU4727109.1 hypothetical protein [Citrobacter freundii]EKV2293420.1 hypothetical protein [Citrobacter freundii]EKW0767574.1 hypothetical protein [Citrobacter freundii]MCR3680409.1 hypothetical protein [Citrobacter freundii]
MAKARVNFFESERYECHCNNKELKREDVENSWLCPDCNDHVYIYASDGENKGVFIRKRGSEIVKGDLVRPDGFSLNEHFQVLGVTPLTSKANNGKLGLGLKGYRQTPVNPDDFISCRIGAW